jgi:hypothetical protein
MPERYVIDLIKEFEKHQQDVCKYWKARINGYFDSDCYKQLDNKLKTMQNCANLKPATQKFNDWQSSVSFPIVKERMLLRRAILSANYRAPEIFSLSPIGGTSYENASKAQATLNLNMRHTRYREKSLKPGADAASKFGFFVSYTYWKRTGKPEMRTTFNSATRLYERKRTQEGYENVYTCNIKARDYFQNPDIADPEESDFQGHIRRVHISDLVPLLNDGSYITENVKKVLEEARKGMVKGMVSNREKDDFVKYDEKRHYIDIYRIEGKINIKGNEEDGETYVTEIVGDTIIRLSREDYDRNMRSYVVTCIDKSSKYWFGVTDAEYVVTHENYLNTILSMNLDNAMRAINQYIFYNKESISPSELANIQRNGGLIGVDTNETPINQLINAFQPGSIDMNPAQFAVNAVQQSIQSMSTKADLSRKPNEGGPTNKTATAANIIAGQGDLLEADLLENFDFGIIRQGFVTMIMLQQFLPQLFYIRPNAKQKEQEIEKWKILGDFDFDIQSTMQKNQANELMRLQNIVTWWLNIAQNPILQGAAVNILPLIKEIWNKADVPSDEIMPEETVNPQLQPSNPMMSMQGGGMVPAPAPAIQPTPVGGPTL